MRGVRGEVALGRQRIAHPRHQPVGLPADRFELRRQPGVRDRRQVLRPAPPQRRRQPVERRQPPPHQPRDAQQRDRDQRRERQQHQPQRGEHRAAPHRQRLGRLDRVAPALGAAGVELVVAGRAEPFGRAGREHRGIGVVRQDQHRAGPVAQQVGEVFVMRRRLRGARHHAGAVVVVLVVLVILLVVVRAVAAPRAPVLAVVVAAIAVGLDLEDGERQDALGGLLQRAVENAVGARLERQTRAPHRGEPRQNQPQRQPQREVAAQAGRAAGRRPGGQGAHGWPSR